MLKRFALYFNLICLAQSGLHAAQVSYLGETYFDCEKEFSWIKQKTLGYGPYGYVHQACSKQDESKCDFAAKIQRALPGFQKQRNEHEREAAILKKLAGKNIAPNIYEDFSCKIKNNQTGQVREVGVIILDKFDQTFFDLLNLEFIDFLVQKFGSKEKALDYLTKSLRETNPTSPQALTLPKRKNGLTRANEALQIGRTNNLKANKARFLRMPLSEETTKILSKIDDILVKIAENKIIHRDMKVDNIMTIKVDNEHKPIVIDYGLSFDTGREEDTMEGNLNGYWDETFQINAPGTHEKKVVDDKDYCYDRVVLEVELFFKYGIKYKFKSVDDACRKYIYNNYLTPILKDVSELIKF